MPQFLAMAGLVASSGLTYIVVRAFQTRHLPALELHGLVRPIQISCYKFMKVRQDWYIYSGFSHGYGIIGEY